MKKICCLLFFSLMIFSTISTEEEITISAEVEKAIEKGLAYLATKQNADGSFHGDNYGKNVGVHSLAMMAFMSMGNLPGEGKYGDVVAKALDWLMDQAKPSGLIEYSEQKNRGPAMYGHALATLALSEVWGQSRRKDVGSVLNKAVELIVRCQGPGGSWGYYSTPADGDTSVTVMQIFALKSAHEAGIFVSEETMNKALKVVKSRFDKKNKMYGYNGPHNSTKSNHVGSHAAGTCIMQICGEKDPLYTKEALEQCVKVVEEKPKFNAYFFYYGSVCSYYAGGKAYADWRNKMEPIVLKEQRSNGMIQNVLGTAWGVLALSLPYRYIPVYQHEEK